MSVHFLGGYAEWSDTDTITATEVAAMTEEKPQDETTETVEEHERVVIRETEETTVTEPADETDGEPEAE